LIQEAVHEIGPVVNGFPIEMLPVVQTGASEPPVVQAETEGADQPELGSHGHARSPHVARVVGNFRLMKDDVEQGL
jgi:hypothetical protein